MVAGENGFMRTVFVNGAYVPENQAKISVFDRGFLFADGVYEVTAVLDGKLVDADAHLARLRRSLGELRIEMPMNEDGLLDMHRELVSRNAVGEGGVYLQITRGAAERDFAFPDGSQPGVVAFTQSKPLHRPEFVEAGVSVVTVPEIRWQRRDIKSVALLAQVLGKQMAREQGAFEGWMVEHGVITEGTSSTAFIVNSEGTLVTRQLSNAILPGVTRLAVLELVGQTGLDLEERPFTPEEAYTANEAFLTSASAFVAPVVEIDGRRIGPGRPGPIALKLRELYIARALETAV